MVKNWSKNSTWHKLNRYYNRNKKENSIIDLISKINEILNKNALTLLKIALINLDKMSYVLDLLEVLKANYDGKHTISLTDPRIKMDER